MSFTFVSNRGWPQRLLRQAEAERAAVQIAGDLAESIRGAVPVVTGQTLAEYGAMTPTAEDGGARIPIASHIWHIIEFGTSDTPAWAPIRRGADNLGLEIDMSA